MRQLAFDDLQCADVDRGLEFTISSVKVWRRVVVEVFQQDDVFPLEIGDVAILPDDVKAQLNEGGFGAEYRRRRFLRAEQAGGEQQNG